MVLSHSLIIVTGNNEASKSPWSIDEGSSEVQRGT